MENNTISDKEIQETTKKVLKNMGMKINFLGFKYWQTAVIIVMNRNQEKLTMTRLYMEIAKRHRTTFSRVERAMRYAYQELDLKQYFDVKYKISNMEMLFLLQYKVQEILKV